MKLALFLKVLCELCFYFTVALPVGGSLGVSPSLLAAAFLLALTVPLGALLSEKSGKPALRFVPLVLTGLLWFFRPGTAGSVILILPVIYIVLQLAQKRFEADHHQLSDNFLLFSKILILPPVILLLLSRSDILRDFCLPPLLIFLMSGILALRTLRHDRRTMESRSFQLMNLGTATAVSAVALVLAVPRLREALWAAVTWVYEHVIIHILMVFVYLFGAVGWVLERFLKWILSRYDPERPEQEQGASVDEIIEDIEEAAEMPFLKTVLRILGIALAALALFLILRWLYRRLKGRSRRTGEDGGEITRISLEESPSGDSLIRRREARTPSLRVRWYYRKMLLLLRSAGGRVDVSMTTKDQLFEELRLFPELREEAEELRALYLPARYGDTSSEADAARARELFRSLRAKTREKKEA